MTALVRTELLKLLWTRATWGLLTAALLLVVGRVVLLLGGVGRVAGPAPGSAELTWAVLGCSGLGIFVIVLLGVLSMTRELHSGTWTSTLLVTPRRRRLVVAKVLAASVTGGAVSALLLAVAAVAGLASGDVVFSLDAPLVRFVVGAVAAGACWAWLGVGVGVLVRNQTVALLLPVAWLLVVETLLASFGLRQLLPWTPGGATRAISGEQFPGGLPVGAALSLLVGYATALTVAGAHRLVRADVS
jgi:ABC-type transport system involved in multi-copper enzyme maturation permease subunit